MIKFILLLCLALAVSSADGKICAKTISWKKLSGGLKQIDSRSATEFVGVNSKGSLYHYIKGKYTFLSPGKSHVSIGKDGSIWATSKKDGARLSRKKSYHKKDKWVYTKVWLTQVDAYDMNLAVGTDKYGRIWTYKSNKWTMLTKKRKEWSMVSIGADKSLWATGPFKKGHYGTINKQEEDH